MKSADSGFERPRIPRKMGPGRRLGDQDHRECGRAFIWRGFFGAIWHHAWMYIGCLEGRPRLKNLRHAVNSETWNGETRCEAGPSPASSDPRYRSGMFNPRAIGRTPRYDGRSRSQRAFSTNTTRMPRLSRVNVRPVCPPRCFNTTP